MGKRKLHIGSLMHILLIVMALLLLFGQLSLRVPREDARRLRFFGEWSRDGEIWYPYEDRVLSSIEGDLYLWGNFGMQLPEGSVISFYGFHIQVSVELNGKPLFLMEKETPCNANWISVKTPHVFPSDKFLFRLSNPHILGNAQAYMQLLDNIYYGDLNQIRQTVERQDAARRLVGSTVIVFSLAVMGIVLVFGVMRSRNYKKLQPIGLMAFCYGGYLWLSSPSVTLGVGIPSLIPCALFICVIAALLELSLLLRDCLTGGRRKASAVLLALQYVWLLCLLIGNLVGKLSFCRLLDLWIPPQICCVGILLGLGIWEWTFVAGRYPGLLALCGILMIAVLLETVNEWLLLWKERLILDSVVALFFFIYAVYGIVSVPVSFRTAARAEKLKTDLEQNRIVLAMSQIRAHFIFNILNAISGMCKYDPEKADATLIRFARYLRGNIDVMQKDELEPFSASLQHLQDYITLEQVRFGDRIRFQTQTEVTDFYLPPLVLQPLVENAIKHGLTPKAEGGTITLSTERQGDRICITVSDDGVGYCTKDPVKQGSVGLSNVRFRLKQLVDGELKLESTPGQGTVATVTISAARASRKT
ncbi:MAG: histidine kinase [Oscillospiraceae bacterium]|nr:histidine kinase [Oscillospiraceae bacterium]